MIHSELESSQVTTAGTSDRPVKNLWLYSVIAVIIFVITLIMGLVIPPQLAGTAMSELAQMLKSLSSLSPPVLLLLIFLNNAIKTLAAIGLGVLIALPSLFFVGANGFILGMAVSSLTQITNIGIITASLAPHGIIEIPVLIISSALGIRIGFEVIKRIAGRASQVKKQLQYGLLFYVKYLLPALVLAAFIEIFITPIFVLLAGGKDLFIK